jgi:uncharacterized glyoxalase superfamily protein PhnB
MRHYGKNFKPNGHGTRIPYIAVQNAEKSLEFYHQVFGFELASDPVKEDSKVQRPEMKLGRLLHNVFA